ncbi:MAG: cupredoxin domain-containing protein, partial [bacterium]
YIFQPSQILVRKGDRVTLKIIGLNGAKHTVAIERFHPKPFTIKRGRITTVSFTADTAGNFRIVCSEHPPSMTGEIIVLDR